MRFLVNSVFLVLFAGIAVYSSSGAKVTGNSTAVVSAKTDGETVVCNQYIGQDNKAHEAIKKLDEKLSKKLDQLIKLLQPSPGQPAFTCKEIFEKNLSRGNKAYTLSLGSTKIPVYCHMVSAGLGACGGGGWTLVMKIDGSKRTFHYDSKFWSNKIDFNLAGGKTGFDSQESKLPTYWNTPFSKICLAMKIGTQIRTIMINKHARSLYSLIADGKYRGTSLGRNTWKTLIGPQASLQTNCAKEGFNVLATSNAWSKARIGIIGNNENDCASCDSRIGFGTGGHHDDSNTCGNEASHGGDKGDKHIKAMGYILVQ